MSTITHLPDEIIATILENKNISIEDIVNLKSTCKRLQHTTFSTTFWEKKYFQRFSLSKRIQQNIIKKYKKRLEKIFNHLEAGVKCIEELRHYVSLMITYDDLPNIKKMELNKLLRSTAENSIICRFVLDDIDRIISAQLSWHDSNLTVKYYFGLIYHWLKQYRLVYKQTKFIYMPKEKLLLEKQITIIAHYFKPVSYSIIDTWLNDIAQEVLSHVKNKYPTHSIFATSSEQFTFWRKNNINDNFWDSTEANQIMCILDEIIFSDSIVYQIHRLLITLNVEGKFMNYILQHYKTCLLSIIYHSIARRLGILCFLNYKCGFAMAVLWEPKYYTEGYQMVRYFYMMSCEINSLNIERGVFSLNHPLNPLYNILQIRNLIFNLYKKKNHCDLCTDLLVKHQVSYKWKMMYMLNFLSRSLSDNIEKINMDYEYAYIARLIKNRSNIVINEQSKIRKREVKFTIGTFVTHSSNLSSSFEERIDRHDGVIIGWHYKCKASLVQRELYSLVPHLKESYKNHHTYLCRYPTCESDNCRFVGQPHYLILAENNIICYVPQDMVSKCPPKWINNVEIGRYFSKFEGIYVPNESLARNYPTDIAVKHEIFSNQ